MTTASRLLIAAEQRHWVLSTAELRELGLSNNAVRTAMRHGILHRLHRGVYAVGRPELAPEGRWRAATLAVSGGVLCSFSAAALWGLVGASGVAVDVAIASQVGRDRPSGVRLHRCDRLLGSDVTYRGGIPVTRIQRTLRDLAGPLDARALTQVVRQAERLHRVDLGRILHAMGPPRPGANRENRLRKALEAYVPGDVRAGLEEATLAAFVAHGVPVPRTQHPIGAFFADFAWPDVRLVVEVDDRASHDTWTQAQADRARDRSMAAAGWEVMRFTWAEVTREPARVAAEVVAALIRKREVVTIATTSRL